MRFLDTRTLHQLDRQQRLAVGPGRARQRSYIWLAWVLPHFHDHRAKRLTKTDTFRWPVYLLHGRAAA